MTQFRWGIFGTGAISAKFAAGLARAKDARVAMVASRDAASGRAFADAFGVADVVAGYEAAATAAPGLVDAIYIATPPALHHDHALLCLGAGVPVLIEKPFALDAAQARAIAAAARDRGVFCMEAMWTRFMPAARRLAALIGEGAIGEPHLVAGSFGISNAVDPAYGNFDPARGGGALAHLGFYPVSLGQWLFGTPVASTALGRVGTTNVDEDVGIALRYPAGVTASFHASLRAPAANDFVVHGTHGSLGFAGPIYRPWGVTRSRTAPRPAPGGGLSKRAIVKEGHFYQRLGQLREMIGRRAVERHPFAGNGYFYEAEEVAACVRSGRTESAIMPLSDSVAVAETLDTLRAAIHRSAHS